MAACRPQCRRAARRSGFPPDGGARARAADRRHPPLFRSRRLASRRLRRARAPSGRGRAPLRLGSAARRGSGAGRARPVRAMGAVAQSPASRPRHSLAGGSVRAPWQAGPPPPAGWPNPRSRPPNNTYSARVFSFQTRLCHPPPGGCGPFPAPGAEGGPYIETGTRKGPRTTLRRRQDTASARS